MRPVAALELEIDDLVLNGFPEEATRYLPIMTARTIDPFSKKSFVQPVAKRCNIYSLKTGPSMSTAIFPMLAKVAPRPLSMHVTTCACERNWKLWGQIFTKYRASMRLRLGEILVYLRANGKFPKAFMDEEVMI